MSDLISVIVPVYKTEKYLNKCVESIINQTYKNLEIILVDDGSPDNCSQICDGWAKKDGRIRVLHQENAGVSTARNVGIDIANGKYICFVDSDDIIEKDYVSRLYRGLVVEEYDLSVCNMLRDGIKAFDEDETLLTGNLEDDYVILDYGLSGPCCKLYDSDIIKKNNLRFDKNINYGEDTLFVLEYLKYVRKINFINQVLYVSNKHEGSLTMRHGEKEFNDLLYVIARKKKFVESRNVINSTIVINHLVCLAGSFFIKISKDDNYQYYLQRLKRVLEFAEFNGETKNLRQKIALKMWQIGLCWPLYLYGKFKYRQF